MTKLYTLDTAGLISYFHSIFGCSSAISSDTNQILDKIFEGDLQYRLSIPSIVFIEIYEKWFDNEEFRKKFFYEVLLPIKESKIMEIRPIDMEIMINVSRIQDELLHHDLHDKIILASAIALQSTLITTDKKIIQYVKKTNIIPHIIS